MNNRQEIETAWQAIRTHLERERHQLYEEIRQYPTPIAACDQQFNHLLEERGRIYQELRRLDDAIVASQSHSDPSALVDDFIASSKWIGDMRRV